MVILRWPWRVVALGCVVALVVASALVSWVLMRSAPTNYVTAPVTRGDVATTVAASGTINPVITVQVGTYVSGTIISLPCDYNTRVSKGQLCAKIDPAPYQIVVDQDAADLALAKAQLVKDQANLEYTRLANDRAQLLFKQDSGSRDAADSALSAYHQAIATVAVDQATIQEKGADLKAAQINLNYTNIISPVDGTVVTRDVTAGQTVAASLQTPTLFLIATDLTKMQVDTNVSESDIAGVVEGASASFAVDAYPNKQFQGIVTQVRQSPSSVQNVITYDVVIAAANPQLLLMPGMTATAAIVKSEVQNVLRVPSAALRFTPAGAPSAATGKGAGRAIWVQREGELVRVPVTVGIDNSTYAEIKSGDLKVGDQVVVSMAADRQAGAAAIATGQSLHL